MAAIGGNIPGLLQLALAEKERRYQHQQDQFNQMMQILQFKKALERQDQVNKYQTWQMDAEQRKIAAEKRAEELKQSRAKSAASAFGGSPEEQAAIAAGFGESAGTGKEIADRIRENQAAAVGNQYGLLSDIQEGNVDLPPELQTQADMPSGASSLKSTRDLLKQFDETRSGLKRKMVYDYGDIYSKRMGTDAFSKFAGFEGIAGKVPEFRQKIDTAVALGLGTEAEVASKILMNEAPGPDYKPHIGPQGQVVYVNQDPKPGENILNIPTNPDGSAVIIPGMAEDYDAKLTTLGGEIYAQRRAATRGDKEAVKLHGERIQRIVTGLDMLVPTDVWDENAKATLVKWVDPRSPEARAGIMKRGPEAPPPKVQEDIQSAAFIYDLTERMREWVVGGNTEGWRGYWNKSKQIAADIGLPIRDQDLFDFNANLNTITSRIDEIAKGNPSDRDIPRYLAAFPDMIQAAGSNEAKINVIQYMNKETMRMRLAFMKASRYAIPKEIANTAKAMGIDINKINETDYVGFDETTREPIQQGAKLKATMIKNAPANIRDNVRRALDAKDAAVLPGSTPVKVY